MARAQTKPTLILGAMPSEVRLINERLTRKSEGKLECFPYQTGWIGKQKVVVAVTGVGVTNGAMVAALFIHHFKPTELIVSGTGSRFNPRIRTGDTIISKRTIHHAAGSLTSKGMVYRKVRGPLPGQMTHYAYPPDPGLFKLAKAAIATYQP
ncbi:MAG: 5'-methylthioadenosine nucleosidase, partial [Verrucomicrobiae bacterium]|nr:5'-methylthioadenosine nucleosidase [Verrucomicrobiae bacterium]